MDNALLVSIIICISLFFIINMIDGAILEKNNTLYKLYQNECSKTDTLKKIIKEIQRELRLTQLKECPPEELKQIPKEIIAWIDLLDIGEKQLCQEVSKK